jgi:hypothetical protein
MCLNTSLMVVPRKRLCIVSLETVKRTELSLLKVGLWLQRTKGFRTVTKGGRGVTLTRDPVTSTHWRLMSEISVYLLDNFERPGATAAVTWWYSTSPRYCPVSQIANLTLSECS